ncbi:MAG: ATPase [Zymomonas mobilis subsp. pomaceae]|uniref:ATP synthase subunit b n=1 Tax=Zymomonas mobilis subsp. pomaceae (strain ATCC 29192 / DSM 22645 / JCM 10191 / CCUG 17912 / NBRC 13757 / NCIMB 11200 / NRRL B-4491 / Barker I) TaxID=579138 RepID=F8EVY4_ZYMMT|nr:ATPase [Zymomonas mobilis]AEI37461.1 H+transporting two-sector ATPase B/B' subunit [Zymomonas mobilis subsp. pomaceae ATCC 29192]MDX5948828.1 ATPase [Zymomonas mobilis subsp. pomaceae]GEB88636.1 hypothetical protein ZMO02_02730 [Zymomonas mobilis subsp. pomaceae]
MANTTQTSAPATPPVSDTMPQTAPGAPNVTASTEAPGGVQNEEPHESTLLGLSGPGWVSASIIVFLLILIWKKVPSLITSALDKQIGEIRNRLGDAERLRKEAEALRAEYDEKARQAAGEAEAIVERAKEEATSIVAEAQKQSQQLVERRQKMATDQIAAAEQEAIVEIQHTAAKLALQAATRIIQDRNDASHDKALIDQTIESLSQPRNRLN